MNLNKLVSLVVLSTLILSSCAGNSQMKSNAERTLFTEARYTKACEDIKAGAKPIGAAPTDPLKNEFAIIPLDESKYGVKSFVFYPSSDMLSDNEVLQVAKTIGDVSYTDLFDRIRAYKMYSNNAQSNRDRSDKEQLNLLAAYGLYLGKNERPQDKLSDKSKDGESICVKIGSGDGLVNQFWIYPTAQLTRDDMLKVVERELRHSSNENLSHLQPLESEIQYDQANETAIELLDDFVPTDLNPATSDNIVLMYKVPISSHDTRKGDYWSRRFVSEVGYDVEISISAADGSLLNWQSFQHGKFGHLDEVKDGAKSYTNEDAQRIAEEYLKAITLILPKYGLKEARVINEVSLSKFAPDAFSVDIYLDAIEGDDMLGALEVRKSDLTILGFFIGGNRSSMA